MGVGVDGGAITGMTGSAVTNPDVLLRWEPDAAASKMVFKPHACRTRWEGVAVTGWILLVDLLMLIWIVRRPIDWLKFALIVLIVASIPIIVHLAYRTWSAFSLEYWLDRNALTVRWASSREVIPLNRVIRLIRDGMDDRGGAGWLFWPAPYLGCKGRTLGVVNITMLSTRRLSESLLLDAGNGVFALSPEDEEDFIKAIQVRRMLGPVKNVEPETVRRSAWNRSIEADPLGAMLFAAGIVGALALFGLLMLGFRDLPDALAFHYNGQGVPDLVRGKGALFLLPFIGLLAWSVNGAWGLWMMIRGERIGGYMLWGGSVIVQIFCFMALVSLMY